MKPHPYLNTHTHTQREREREREEEEMEFGASSSACLCRICHEEEDENSTTMEAPCSCSGTQKFAHRECIQKWCDEKGSIICEICLEKFEPGYTVPPKLGLIDIDVTIRGSLEVPRLNYESQDQGSEDGSDQDNPECSPASDRGTTVCRSIALMLSLFLLARHFVVVVSAGSSDYPFAIATVFLLRASGIIVPIYFFMRLVAAYQKGRRRHLRYRRDSSPIQRAQGEEEEPEELAHHTIQIHS